MEAIERDHVISKDGELVVSGLPFKTGETIHVILIARKSKDPTPRGIGIRELKNSKIFGMWKNRTDIGDSTEYARKLRKEAANR